MEMQPLSRDTYDWWSDAACRHVDPEQMFPDTARGRAPSAQPGRRDHVDERAVCSTCPVRFECLIEALDNRIEYGIWGGMTERERYALLRRRPGVTSWRRELKLEVRR